MSVIANVLCVCASWTDTAVYECILLFRVVDQIKLTFDKIAFYKDSTHTRILFLYL